jgi:hypothetical protein
VTDKKTDHDSLFREDRLSFFAAWQPEKASGEINFLHFKNALVHSSMK